MKGIDDDNDGLLDREEFYEAMNEVDKDATNSDLEHIFNTLSYKNSNEISIKVFIKHIRTAQSKAKSLTSPTPQTIFRGAFPDVFEEPQEDDTRELWGDNQVYFTLNIRKKK